MVKANWSIFEEDFYSLERILKNLIQSSSSKSVMLIDKTGQMVSSIGEPPGFDVTSFSSLTAASFSANQELASMVGEMDFNTIVHQGQRESMYVSLIGTRVILVVLFDRTTSLGLVRLKARRSGEELLLVLTKVFDKLEYRNEDLSATTLGAEFTAEAESEIDSLFKE